MSIVFRELFPSEEGIGKKRKKWFEEYTGQPEIIISYRKDSDDDNSRAVCGFTSAKGFECFIDSLEYVAFDDNIRIIMGMAFQGFRVLKKVVLPKTMDYIGMNAFDGCISLKSIELPRGLGGVPAAIFRDCKSLEYVYIPDDVEIIGTSAFEGCTSLKSIYLPPSVKYICRYAFSNCTNLERIEGGAGIKQIELCAFLCCEKLTEFPFRSTIECLEPCAFDYTRVEIPKSILIKDSLPQDKLTVTIHDGTITLTDFSLVRADGRKWERVILPESVRNISINAFSPLLLSCVGTTEGIAERRIEMLPEYMNMPKDFFRQETDFNCDMALLLADTVWKEYVTDSDFETMLLHQSSEKAQSKLRKRLSNNCNTHLENMLNCTDNSPLQLERIAAYAATYAGSLEEKLVNKLKNRAEEFKAFDAISLLTKYSFTDYGDKDSKMSVICSKELLPYEAEKYFEKEVPIKPRVLWKNSNTYVPSYIVTSVLYAYIEQAPENIREYRNCPDFHRVSAADAIASEFDRDSFLLYLGALQSENYRQVIPICRYGDEKIISELLLNIKKYHQSVRSILPKIVRKALKLSDYVEDLGEEY